MKRNRIAIVGVLGICAAVSLTTQLASAQTTNVAVSPGTRIVTSSGQFNLDIVIANATDLHAANVRIVFNKTVLQYDGVTGGSFLPDVFMPSPYIVAGTTFDTINVDQATLGPGGVNGSGTLFSVKFNGKSDGVSVIKLQTVDLRSNTNAQIPSTRTDGEVTVQLEPVLAASVVVSPGTKTVASLEQFTLDINVADVTDLHAANVKVVFDKTILHYDQVIKGNFLPDAFMPPPYVGSGAVFDTINVDLATLGAGGVNGSGNLFSVQFTSESDGISVIKLQTVDLRSSANAQIPSTKTDGQVTVYTPPLAVNLKAMLAGPYSGSTMSMALRTAGFVPLGQPYDGRPWDYTGTESVASIPEGVVDWVLVELRNGTAAGTKVAMRAAFIKSDGMLVDLDGTSPVAFNTIPAGSYYVVVRHRNHLAVMSVMAVALSSESLLFDFTVAGNAYGTNPLVDLGGGVYGMYAGNSDGSNVITVLDYNAVGSNMFQSGYQSGDHDMNGLITVLDYNPVGLNIFKSSQVP